jgi:gliding motility-associated-like protein
MKHLVILFYFIYGLNSLFSQVTPVSYSQFLCSNQIYKNQMICLNERLSIENNLTPFPLGNQCYYESVLPAYNNTHQGQTGPLCPGICCSSGNLIDAPVNVKAFYNFSLICINNPSKVAITKIDDFCWSIIYLDSGSFLFNIDVNVRHGRDIDGYNCIDTTWKYDCGQDRTWKQLTVIINNSIPCNDYSEITCDLINNGGFENYTSCPSASDPFSGNPFQQNMSFLTNWDIVKSTGILDFYHLCGNSIGRNVHTESSKGIENIPPQPFPSGGGYLRLGYGAEVGQFINLCANQKYRFTTYTMRGSSGSQNIVLNGVNTGTFPTTNPLTNLATIPASSINLYYNWHQFSQDFTTPASYNGIVIQGAGYYDNISITPIDTVIFNTQLIADRCDSAEMILNIPGCYGPYNLNIVVNSDTLNFLQIQDGYTLKIPLAKNNIIKVLSITNSLGCGTILNTSDTLIVNNAGDASFTSTSFCVGQTNTITFLADTGIFALVNNTTSATINPSTGIISGANGNNTFIISHAVCLDTVYDTIQSFNNVATFTSSNICAGGVNTINITGTTGGIFSIVPPTNGASIDANTGIVSGGTAGNSYIIKYKVGTLCPDSSTQTIQAIIIGDPNFSTNNFCVNSTNNITITGTTGGVFSFSPLPNDAATINSATGVINNATADSNYTIKYKVGNSCPDSSTQTIQAIAAVDPSFTTGNFCVNSTNTVTITGTTGGVFSLVTPNGATIDANTGIITGANAGNSYTIKYKVGTICVDSLTQTIQAIAIGNPSFTLANLCVNSTDPINITGTLGGTFSFSPTPTDGAIINTTTGVISNAIVNNTYTVKYVTPGACKDSSTQNTTILDVPSSNITSNGAADLCTSDSIPLTINLTGASPWDVTYTDGTSSYTINNVTTSPITIYAKTAGTYLIDSLTDNQCSTSNSDTTSVIISGNSVMFWADATNGCVPQKVKFWSNVNGLNGDCLWSFGDDTTKVNICDTVYHTYQVPGNYAVKLEVSSPKCNRDTMVNNFISIKPNPEAIFYYTPQSPSVLNNTVNFTNSSINNNNNEWYLNNSITSNIPEPEITLPATIGNHEVCLIVENSFGCFDTTCSNIYVLDESLFYIPNAFVPNNDGLNDVFKPVVSNTSSYNIKIFNRWGKLIFETIDTNEGWDGKYKGTPSEVGFYVYRISYRFKGDYDDQFIQGHFSLLR